ncbi:hypothetical protein FACS189491_09750 [Spirochaetia bacterium]|nr:hypothetical protein FACS189491_09750 [Spirochaetia bacterium]
MNALAVLYGGRLFPAAFEKVFDGKSALDLALEQVRRFPGTGKVAFLGVEGEVKIGDRLSIRPLEGLIAATVMEE